MRGVASETSLVVLVGMVVLVALVAAPVPGADVLGWERVVEAGFGDGANVAVRSLRVFDGSLYAGTENSSAGCEVWASPDGSGWNEVADGGFGSSANTAASVIAVFAGRVYVGTRNPSGGCEVWSSEGGTAWSQLAGEGFLDPDNLEVSSTAVFLGQLWVGTSKASGGCEVWRTGNGTSWSQAGVDGFGDGANTGAVAMAAFAGELYVATANAVHGSELWRSGDGTTWARVNEPGFGSSAVTAIPVMLVHRSVLYAGAESTSTGCSLWRTEDGTTWYEVAADGFGGLARTAVTAMAAFDGALHAAAADAVAGTSVWSSPFGAGWARAGSDGFGDAGNISAPAMAAFSDHLVVGTSNSGTGCELWRAPRLQNARYIRPDGADVGDCSSPSAPCATIGYGVEQAVDGDLLRLARGTYTSGATVNHGVRVLTIQGGWSTDFAVRSPDPSLTVLDGDGLRCDWDFFTPGQAPDLTVERMTIQHADVGVDLYPDCNLGPGSGNTEAQYGVSATLVGCVLRDNGTGVWARPVDLCTFVTASLVNTQVVGNTRGVFARGGEQASTYVIANGSTIAGNAIGLSLYSWGTAYSTTHAEATLSGSILHENQTTDVEFCLTGPIGGYAILNASYSDLGTVVHPCSWPGTYYPGVGMINEAPGFAGPGDLHLGVGSPCIDSAANGGNLFDDLDADPRPYDGDGLDGTVADMGADEYWPHPAAHLLFEDDLESGTTSVWTWTEQ